MSQLLITNGDATANLLKAANIPGDVLVWRDPMFTGPFPASATMEELAIIRGKHLGDPQDKGEAAIRDFQLRDHHLQSCARYERINLWFEHDVLDQLQLLQILDWFCKNAGAQMDLHLICINQFNGVHSFRGLGQLSPSQIASLLPASAKISNQMLQEASLGWSAFRNHNPNELLSYALSEPTSFPFMKTALIRFLKEFPWTSDGLTQTERQILQLLGDGVADPGDLFELNMQSEECFFMGDWPTYAVIASLCSGKSPLCETRAEPFWYPPLKRLGREQFRAQRLQLTRQGRDVLEGKSNAHGLLPRPEWRGGVQLKSNDGLWCWDPQKQKMVTRQERSP